MKQIFTKINDKIPSFSIKLLIVISFFTTGLVVNYYYPTTFANLINGQTLTSLNSQETMNHNDPNYGNQFRFLAWCLKPLSIACGILLGSVTIVRYLIRSMKNKQPKPATVQIIEPLPPASLQVPVAVESVEPVLVDVGIQSNGGGHHHQSYSRKSKHLKMALTLVSSPHANQQTTPHLTATHNNNLISKGLMTSAINENGFPGYKKCL